MYVLPYFGINSVISILSNNKVIPKYYQNVTKVKPK